MNTLIEEKDQWRCLLVLDYSSDEESNNKRFWVKTGELESFLPKFNGTFCGRRMIISPKSLGKPVSTSHCLKIYACFRLEQEQNLLKMIEEISQKTVEELFPA